MKRPLLAYFFALLAGVGFGLLLELELNVRFASREWLSASVLFSMVICMTAVYMVKLHKWLPFFLIIFIASFGYFRTAEEFTIKDLYVDNLARSGKNVVFSGRITDLAVTSSKRLAATVRLHEIRELSDGISHSPVRNVSLMVYFDERDILKIGQDIEISGKIYVPDRALNPGGFDGFIYYKSIGVDYTAYAEGVRKGNVYFSFRSILHQFRERLSAVFDIALPEEEAGIIKSIVLGEKSGLSDEIKELYSIGGIYHLIAISGLHIMLLSDIMLKGLNRFIKIQHACVTVIVFIWVYCAFTGAAIATVRASVMITVTFLGKIAGRDSDPLTNPAFTCMFLLVRRPLYLTNLGFLLTFTAVFGIALFKGIFIKAFYYIECTLRTPDKRSSKVSYLRESVAVFLSVSVFTFPVMYFFTCSVIPYSLFVNLLTVPLVELLLIAGIIAALLGAVFINAAIFLSSVIFLILKFYKAVCLFFASLPFSEILIGSCGLALVLIIYAFYLSFLYLTAAKDKPQLKARAVLLAVVSAVLISSSAFRAFPRFQVTMLDVGQSEAIVISKGRFAFVIDGGGIASVEGKNTGQRVLLPYLKHIGASNVAAFITHMDFDHAKGITELAEFNRIDQAFIQSTADNDLYNSLKNSAKEYKIPITIFKKGDMVEYGGIEIKCIYPEAEVKSMPNGSLNDESMVLMVTYSGIRFLFTGDISARTEKALLGYDIRADVLKLAHHGSKYSSSEEFLDTVKPSLAIVSAGKNNVYGFPTDEVIGRLNARGIPLYGTVGHGAVTLKVSDGRLSVDTFR